MLQRRETILQGVEEENGTLKIYKLLAPPQNPEKVRT